MTSDEQLIATSTSKANPDKDSASHQATDDSLPRSIVSAEWAGPLPPPSVLRGFDDIVPGGAERIFKMAEKEQQHRIDYENNELNATRRDFRRGQVLGAVLTTCCLASAVYSIYAGAHPAVSIALLGIPITALIGKIIKM